MTQVDAIVLAGGTPEPGELLYPYTQGQPKALLEMGGRPMLHWILTALDQAPTIRRIAVSGLAAPGEAHPPTGARKPLVFSPDQGTMMGNAQGGAVELAKTGPLTPHVLVVSSDIPTITPQIVDWIVTTSLETDHEGYYSLIPREKMETRFPGSRRSYFYFKDGVFTGSDINVMATSLLAHGHAKAPALIEARKNIFRQAQLIGFDVLFLFALRQLTVAEAARLVSQRLKIKGRALICPYAEAGMDVDKPKQYDLVKADLESETQTGGSVTEPWPRRWQLADERLSTRLRVAERPGRRRRLAALLAHSGDSWYWLAALAVSWVVGGSAWKVFVIQLVLGILATAAVVMAIKLLVRRRRPAGEWGAVYRRTDPLSFPSGHAARMAMLAIAGLTLGHPWFGLILALWAPLVGLARVAMGVHYVSDVVGGLLIGVGAGLALGWLL